MAIITVVFISNKTMNSGRIFARISLVLVILSMVEIFLIDKYIHNQKDTGDHNISKRLIIYQQEQNNRKQSLISQQGSPATTSTINDKEDQPLPFFFSACLMIKDNNVILPEWLAYHYTVLPLRRLIVGVDPMSHTDPTPILNKYESIGMNITTWTDDSYWVEDGDGIYPHEKKDFIITNTTTNGDLVGRLKHRQKIFLKACLSQLKEEMRTWTIIVDADEYFAFNYYDEKEGAPTFCKNNVSCAQSYEKSIRDGSHVRSKLDRSPSATVAQHIYNRVDRLFGVLDKPCIIFGRYLFVSKESDQQEIQGGVEPEFNSSYFHTLRYLHRVPLSTYQLGKPIIDVSRYDGMDIFNTHRPLRDSCTGSNAYVHNAVMSFRVHHYVGSWETFRKPGVDIRGKKNFNQRNKVKGLVLDKTTTRYFAEDAKSTTWLTQFVKLVGKEKALELTQQIRVHEELEMEKMFEESANGEGTQSGL